MTTRTSATSGNWRADDADTWGLGIGNYPAAGEHVVIDTGHTVTLGESNNAGSIKLIGTLAGGGYTLTLNDGGDSEIFDHDGTITGTLNITITGTTNRLLDLSGSSGNVNNLIINASSTTFTLSGTGTHTVAGNLTITAGTLDTDSSNNRALTVTGNCDVTGTLTLNDSTVAVGALRTNSNAALTLGSSGTLELTTASNFGGTEGANYSWRNIDGTSDINLGGTLTVSAAGYFEPRTAPDYASVLNNLVWNTNYYWVGKLTIGGTLVVNASKLLQTYNGSKDCIVNGDVTLNGHLKALGNNVSAMEFKSLTIASGGQYSATSGTNTITGKNSSNYMFDNNGTFTHNKGTVHWKADTSSGTWYAMDGHTSSTGTEFYNISTERVRSSGTEQYRFWVGGSGRHLTVLNDIDIGVNTSVFSSNGTSVLTHFGNCYLKGTSGGLNLDNVTTVNMGTVTIESGATLEFADGNSINVEGIRNIGGTVTAT